MGANLFIDWRIRKYPTKVLALPHASVIALLCAALVFVIGDLLCCSFFIHQRSYLIHVEDTEPMRMITGWLTLGWLAHITVLRKQQKENLHNQAFHEQSLINLRDAELFKLRQQLQPHFLYNSLNSINALVQIDPEKAQEMVGKLSDFLRLSVKKDTDEKVKVNDEINYIEAYLAIESVRFGNRLNVAIERPEDIGEALIPAFILQPILENAIKFGLYGNTGSVLIAINLWLYEHMLNIEIQNPYDPTMSNPKGTGFGLEGVSRRLQIIYGRSDLLSIKKENNIFTTHIKIPQ